MTLNIFPALAGLGWPASKTAQRRNRTQRTVSGREMVIQDQPIPLYLWTLPFEILRTGADTRGGGGIGTGYSEFDQLAAFFNQQGGGFLPFLLTDPTDSAVTNQPIGAADGTTRTFQLQRTQGLSLTSGGYTEPVYAPNTVSAVYLNGSAQSPSAYTVAPASLNSGGSLAPGSGMISFGTAPGAGAAITASFTYYWPVRFADDSVDFDYILYQIYAAKQIKLKSVLP